MPFLATAGAELFYTDSAPGSGHAPLVFVHGWTCDSHDWSWQLAELGRRRRVVAVDLRGHGRSSVPATGYTLGDYAGDVRALLAHLDGAPAVLVGHSMGALVSSVLVDQDGDDRVAALVVIDPPYDLDAAATATAADFARRVAAPDGVRAAYDWLAAADADATPRWLATWHRRRILAMPHHVLSQTVAAVHDDPTSIANFPHTRRLWARRTLPTLVLVVDPAHAERERAYFTDPRSRAVAYPGAGHWLHQERADEVNAELTDWLDVLGAA